MLDTNVTVQQIEDSLLFYCGGPRKNIAVPNVSWGLLSYEADFLIMNKSGYVTEFEIKRSFSDFLADFKKSDDAHNSPIIYKFYYVVPKSVVEKVLTFLQERFQDEMDIPAVLSYDEDCRLKPEGGYPFRSGARKLFLEEQLQLARLGTLRYWSLREKLKTVETGVKNSKSG